MRFSLILLASVFTGSLAAAAEIPADVANRIDIELRSRCAALYRAADHVSSHLMSTEVNSIDQGQSETIYTIEVEFSADSLPSRIVRVIMIDTGVSNPTVERVILAKIESDGRCRE